MKTLSKITGVLLMLLVVACSTDSIETTQDSIKTPFEIVDEVLIKAGPCYTHPVGYSGSHPLDQCYVYNTSGTGKRCCTTPSDQDRMGNQCIEYGQNGCLGKGIPELNYTITGEEKVFVSAQLYNCNLDESGQITFCGLDVPLLQGEIYVVLKNNSGNQPPKVFRYDEQQEEE